MPPKYTKYLYIVPVLVLVAVFAQFFGGEQRSVQAAVGCDTSGLSGNFESSGNLAFFNDTQVFVPEQSGGLENRVVLGAASPDERWIEVDLSEQKLRAWNGNQLFLETLVSTGLPGTPTPTGEFRIWIKLRATKMEGGVGRNYYYLPNVPYVMFFENDQVAGRRGYGLHGTYWHNDFGRPKSHGCVNLPTNIAEQIYFWATPELPVRAGVVKASAENPGTRIIIHD